ncbi:MAG: hypothetical protein IKN54_08410, partial [Lachnospiraceae bacterium]|nr:hypothetical protein [Lachnospiraceae bacterium]
EQFKADVQTLKNKGQHVIISVGGAEGRIAINSDAAADKFASTLSAIIREYGFEGVDIDLEGSAVSGTAYIARGLRKVRQEFGDKFIITMAPETYYMHKANDLTGAYFKLATEIKDILTICYPQFYNAGGDTGYNGFNATYPSQQFITSLATMYIENGLRPDQLAIGVPSTSKAASNGYISTDSLKQVVNSLVYKQTLGGFTPPYEYKTLRGVMTWSINWDATNGYEWARTMKSHMASLPIVEGGVEEQPTTEQVPLSTTKLDEPTEVTGLALVTKDTSSATITWTQTATQIALGQSYAVYVDGKAYGTYSTAQILKINLGAGTHTIKVTSKLNGIETNGSTVSVTIEESKGFFDVDGFQISAVNKGVRINYSRTDKINGKDVVESGIIFGIEGKVADSEMLIGSANSYVVPVASTEKGLLTKTNAQPAGSHVDKSYAMTMQFGSNTLKAFTLAYKIRAYAKLSDGTYAYTNIYNYSVYTVANEVYQCSSMPCEEWHNYLYDSILKVVNPYERKIKYEYDMGITK